MKKLFLIVIVLLALNPKQACAQDIITGKFRADLKSENFTLHEGKGHRSYSIEVKFKKQLNKIPQVILSVNSLDASVLTNIRYKVKPTGISRDGFLIKIETWSDSKIFNIEGNWIAIIKEPEE